MRMKASMVLIASMATLILSAAESYISSGPIVPGEWNSNYKKAREYAEQNNMPFIAIVSRTPAGCHYCSQFHSKWSDANFLAWAKEYGVVMGAFYTAGEPYAIDTAWVDWVRGSNTGYPMVRLYWKKKDGSTVSDLFMGRIASLGDINKDGIRGTQEDFILRIQRAFAGWSAKPKFAGAEKFDSTDAKEVYFSHQDTATGAIVSLPLTREYEDATNQYFVVSYPDSGFAPATNSFNWAQGTKTSAVIARVSRNAYVPGKTAVVDLLDGEMAVVSSVTINFVEPPYLGGVFGANTLNATPAVTTGEITLSRSATDPFSQEMIYSYKGYSETATTNDLGACTCERGAESYALAEFGVAQVVTNEVKIVREVVTTVMTNGVVESTATDNPCETIEPAQYGEVLTEFADFVSAIDNKSTTITTNDVNDVVGEEWTLRGDEQCTAEKKVVPYHRNVTKAANEEVVTKTEITLTPPPSQPEPQPEAEKSEDGGITVLSLSEGDQQGDGQSDPIEDPIVWTTNYVTNVTMVVISTTTTTMNKLNHIVGTDFDVEFAMEEKSKTETIDWGNATEKKITLDFSDAARVSEDDKVAVKLMDGPVEAGTMDIEFIAEDLPNSADNPYFVGEKTAAELNWGDWTMDIEAAKEKAAADNGQMLVVAAGSQWCPDCWKADENLFSNEEFKAWAIEKKVILVQIDLPRKNAEGKSGDVPTLLSPVPHTNGRSGAEYLFRKGIDAETAASVLLRNKQFGDTDWVLGDQKRLGVPTLIKLGSDGKVAGRIADFAIKGPTEYKSEFLTRLDELLATEDGEDANGHFLTTPLSISLGAGTNGVLSAVDRCDIVKVVAKSEGDAFFELKGAADVTAEVTMSLLNSNAVAIADASVTGALDDSGISFTYNGLAKGEYFLRIEGNSANGFEIAKTGDSHVAWELKTSKILIPAETESVDSAIGNSVVMRLEADQLYRIEGLDFTLLEETGLVAQDEGGKGPYFLSSESGDIPLPVLYKDGNVTFQIWNPGTISFTEAKMTVFEFGGTGVVTVVRSGGSSGDVNVDVTKIAGDDMVLGRYEWTNKLLMWNDGETGAKTIEFKLNDNHNFEPQETFEIELSSDDYLGELLTKNMVITVSDTTQPCFNSVVYDYSLPLNFSFADATSVFNIDFAKTISIVRKSGKLPAGITLKYDRVKHEVKIAGTPTKAGTYTATYIIRQGKENGIETTFNFVVFDAAVTGVTGTEETALNQNIGKASNVLVPLFVGDKFVGEITVSTTTRNKISAKYRGDSDSTVSFSGSWQALDVGTGVCSAELKGSKGRTLALEMSPEGRFTATLTGVENALADNAETLTGSAMIRNVEKDAYKAYEGYYTLTIPVTDGGKIYSGTGYMTLTLSGTSALKNGVAKYSGRYGNGTTFSGSLSLIRPAQAGKDYVWAPIFVRTKKDLLSSIIHICPDGVNKCNLEETLQLIKSESEYKSLNRHTETAATYLNEVAVYGGYYKKNRSLNELWEQYYAGLSGLDSALFDVFIGDNPEKNIIADAAVNGTKFIFDTTDKDKDFTVEKMTLSFTKSTGIIRGTVKMTMGEDAIPVNGTWYGIVMPGWTLCGDCGIGEEYVTRPFASGTIYWSQDNGSGKKFKASMPINLEAKKDSGLLEE